MVLREGIFEVCLDDPFGLEWFRPEYRSATPRAAIVDAGVAKHTFCERLKRRTGWKNCLLKRVLHFGTPCINLVCEGSPSLVKGRFDRQSLVQCWVIKSEGPCVQGDPSRPKVSQFWSKRDGGVIQMISKYRPTS